MDNRDKTPSVTTESRQSHDREQIVVTEPPQRRDKGCDGNGRALIVTLELSGSCGSHDRATAVVTVIITTTVTQEGLGGTQRRPDGRYRAVRAARSR